MATYHKRSAVQRAHAAQIDQRWQREYDDAMRLIEREYDEAMRLIVSSGFELQPPAPEMPAKLALHQEQQPDPQFTPHYLQSLLLGILLGGAAAILFEAGRQ